MLDFRVAEDSLFVPMLGRIYAVEQFCSFLQDHKTLELRGKLSLGIKGKNSQNRYALMASAVWAVLLLYQGDDA